MPTYKLTYFDARARGELPRLLMVAAGQAFEDHRIEFTAWPALKTRTPQGSLPLLEINGEVKLCQSQAISRYLANYFNMYGKDNEEAAIIDQLLDTGLDLFLEAIPIRFNSNKTEQAQQLVNFVTVTSPKMLGHLETLAAQTGRNGYAVGRALSVADLYIFHIIDSIVEPMSVDANISGVLKNFPRLADIKKTVEEHPRIKTYLKRRQKTAF